MCTVVLGFSAVVGLCVHGCSRILHSGVCVCTAVLGFSTVVCVCTAVLGFLEWCVWLF